MKQLRLFDEINNEQEAPVKRKSVLWQLYVDGASRNNPGPSGAGIYIVKNGVAAEKHGFYLGKRTNNQAEYLALLLGIFFVKQQVQQGDFIEIVSDSQLLVRQLLGAYRVKNSELQPLHILAKQLLAPTVHKIMHVLREKNVVADGLANKGIDEKIGVPDAFKKMLADHHIMF
ncbi:MAG: ribonuclease HI family protein [Candidatus Dependentiae bacterium]|nr:ribonuclease HI family protein [Candidatus Dependentiae bacterium]